MSRWHVINRPLDHAGVLTRLHHAFETVEVSPLDRLTIGDRQEILSALRAAIRAIEQREHHLPTIRKDGYEHPERQNVWDW